METIGSTDVRARALWFTAPRQTEIREERLGSPVAGQVRVRAIASLVSAGTEMNVYRGQVSTPAELDLPTATGEFPFPMKFAYQVVGEVEEAGAGADFGVGDKVFCYHPHQDHFLIGGPSGPEDLLEGAAMVFPVPADLEPERAVFANLFCVAYNGLLDHPVRIGDCVAISGLGVIGTFAAAMARRTASRLIVVDPLPERRRAASWVGADAAVHPDEAVAAIEELTDGRGVDVYVEASGATHALQGAIDATGQEGTIVVISYYGNREAALRLAPEFHLRRQRIVSSMVGMIGSGLQPRWDAGRRMAVAMEQLGSLDPSPLISHRVPFAEAPSAYRMIDERPQESLGVLLTY